MFSTETYKNPFHRRNGSEELDVFEAAGYFSGTGIGGHHQNPYREDQKQKQRNLQKPGRISLDNIGHHGPIPGDCHVTNHKKHKPKQPLPSSPGSRLASFLNSLFNQTKKKPKPGPAAPAAAEEEDVCPGGGGRRKRRSSISHFRIITKNTYSKALTGPGSRTPDPVCAAADTPTKSYKDPSDRREAIVNSSKQQTLENALDAERKGDWPAVGKFTARESGFLNRDWAGDSCPSDEREFRKCSEDDDDSSESSSDLFDLPSHELDFYPCGLPVYETTHVDGIKIGGPISGVTT